MNVTELRDMARKIERGGLLIEEDDPRREYVLTDYEERLIVEGLREAADYTELKAALS